MREILFRGKTVFDNTWIVGSLVINKVDTPKEFREVYRICDNTYGFADEYGFEPNFMVGYDEEVDPSTVGQYTGKTVKTGKVFEGDIGRSIDGLFLVCWDEEMAAFVMRFDSYPYETLHIEEMWDDAEIIGNIHDNPELMEVRHE